MEDMQSNNLLELLGLSDLPQERREQLAQELSEILEIRVLDRAYDLLSEEHKKQIDELVEAEKVDEVTQFIQQQVPTLMDIFQQEVTKLRDELVQFKDEMRDKMLEPEETPVTTEE